MTDENDSEIVLLRAILQEPNADKAREQYLKVLKVDGFDDREIYDLIEERVFESLLRKEPFVEIESRLARLMLLLLKRGIKRPRGGQQSTRHQEMRKRTLVGVARKIKSELMATGISATEAHLQAADEAAEEGKKHGLDVAAGYLEREMQRPSPRRQ